MTYNRSRFTKTSYRAPSKAPVVVEFRAPSFPPSTYQKAIIDAIRETEHSMIADAVAGSGKTTTLAYIVGTLLEMRRTYVVVAFNKPIATELQERGMNGRTFHSLGYAAVMTFCQTQNGGLRPNMDANKVSAIAAYEYQEKRDEITNGSLVRLVSLAKNHMLTPDATDSELCGIMSHFDIEWDDENLTDAEMCNRVRHILRLNNADTKTIDFDDQLYFVWLHNLRMPTFDFVLVDESQDTNPLRRDLVRRMMHAKSRVIAVGDERQAIYGFTGASHDSLDLIARDFECVRYPLSVSYRCARAIVQEAQNFVPHIMARDNAPDGHVMYAKTFKRADFLSTDLLVCRNTAPLVQTAYRLLAARIPCRIMGREIGASLTSLIKKLSRKSETLETLYDRLIEYKSTEVSKALHQKKEMKAQNITDKVEAICAILDSLTPDDTERGIVGLIAIIDGMFSDKKNGCVTLATVHKSKGLEAPRVFIIDPQLMPSKMARQDWQIAQERNLQYVAITRALDTLVYVKSEDLTD